MSKFLTPPAYNGRALENQWANNVFQSHDLFCGCNKPIQHLFKILYPENKLCLPGIGEDEDDHGKEEDGEPIEEGDLEKLFEDPFTEDSDG